MANNFMLNVEEGFNFETFTEEVTQRYQAQGFQIRSVKMKNGVKFTFDKKCGGINTLLGLGQGISATCTLMGKEKDTLSITFSEAEWTGKIVGLIVGWFLCFIPCITAIIGIVRQTSLPNNISNDITMIISNME